MAVSRRQDPPKFPHQVPTRAERIAAAVFAVDDMTIGHTAWSTWFWIMAMIAASAVIGVTAGRIGSAGMRVCYSNTE